MGNTSKKLAAQCALLTKEEQKYIASTFRTASKNSDKIHESDIIKLWGPQIDPRLAQFLTNYLFGQEGGTKCPTCDFNRFAELYVYNVRGTVDERRVVVYNCLGKEFNESTELTYQLIREYCESVSSSYIRLLKASSAPCAKQWIQKGFRGKSAQIQSLGEALASCVGKDPENPPTTVSAKDVSEWMNTNTLLQEMSELIFYNLYGMESDTRGMDEASGSEPRALPDPACRLLPTPIGIETMPDYPAFIDLSHVVWLNSNIPRKHQNKWRFLFSSHIHGESFSTMSGRIIDSGPSLLIVEDSAGYIFGGYASDSWQVCANFFGNDTSFLFTLAPKMRLFRATGFNNHHQYLNQNTKTMPNGLIMGGQFDFGGIFIHASPFGTGSSAESCSTYRSFHRLSKDKEFKIRSLEVWGVGEKPLTIKESGERDVSILDTNPEAKAILELAGRTRHSEGIREPPPL